jgi:hypothetical protein
MEIGQSKKIREVEPLDVPVPQFAPQPEPVEVPEPAEVPA